MFSYVVLPEMFTGFSGFHSAGCFVFFLCAFARDVYRPSCHFALGWVLIFLCAFARDVYRPSCHFAFGWVHIFLCAFARDVYAFVGTLAGRHALQVLACVGHVYSFPFQFSARFWPVLFLYGALQVLACDAFCSHFVASCSVHFAVGID